MTGPLATVLADSWEWHHGGAGVLMVAAMIVFWAAVVALVFWFMRGAGDRRDQSPHEILRHRLAEGSISVEEYEQRRAALEASTGPGEGPGASAPPPGADETAAP